MTNKEFNTLINGETMICHKKEPNVRYAYMGVDEYGKYKLCGMPFSYSEEVIEKYFEIAK